MKHIYILTGMAFYLGSILDTRLYEYIYLLWLIAFILSWSGWSFLYSSSLLMTTASYEFMSLESSSFFTSSVLPWVFGISLSITLLSLAIKYNFFNNASMGSDSGGGCSGDGGGC